MKILSWNVNGIRAVVRKGFGNFLKKEKPTVLCLQEIKIGAAVINKENLEFAGYHIFWNPAERPGYSGTAILAREEIEARELPKLFWDNEGRIQVLELSKFYLVNVYFPNAGHGLPRLDFKMEFNNKLLRYLKKLEKKKPLVVCGDFNVAHQEIDLARPKNNEGNAGFTTEEREWMDNFLRAGFVDTFRHFYPHKIQYSWWTYKFKAREKNIGWRIDYFCISREFLPHIKRAFILDHIFGSDHCPVGIEVKE
jgi:exodeoxyribonuclease-3